MTEPEYAMLKRLRRRVEQVAPTATVLRAPAEDLPFDDGVFDAVVSTLTLCSVDDQRRAVGELRRVLRPGGVLLFVEHLRADDERVARMQDRLNWLNRLVVCCDCNRPTLDTLRAAGFAISQVVRTELPGAPPFARPLAVGSAVSGPAAASPSGVGCCGGQARSEVGGHRLGVGQLGGGAERAEAVFQNGPSRWVHGPTLA